MGGLDRILSIWMIPEEPKEEIFIDIKCTFLLKVNVTRIYTFYPLCLDLRRLLHEFRGVGPIYYNIT